MSKEILLNCLEGLIQNVNADLSERLVQRVRTATDGEIEDITQRLTDMVEEFVRSVGTESKQNKQNHLESN